jgi:hypothetical protein
MKGFNDSKSRIGMTVLMAAMALAAPAMIGAQTAAAVVPASYSPAETANPPLTPSGTEIATLSESAAVTGDKDTAVADAPVPDFTTTIVPARMTYQPNGQAAANTENSLNGPGWHFAASPYLWFAGLHGTVGVDGYESSLHVSPGDLLSKFDIGFMGAFEARKGRWIIPIDFLWIRLKDDKAIPEDIIGVTEVNVHINESVLTPKAGYRFVDSEKWKVDAIAGFRYWHLGQNIDFIGIPATLTNSQNWVDVIAGARIQKPLSQKITIDLLGDAGGGAANLDYQIVTFLSYKIKPKIALLAGWRYLAINYRPSTTFVNDTVTSGVFAGATFIIR